MEKLKKEKIKSRAKPKHNEFADDQAPRMKKNSKKAAQDPLQERN